MSMKYLTKVLLLLEVHVNMAYLIALQCCALIYTIG